METAHIKQDLLNQATALKVIPTVSSVIERLLDILSNAEASFNDLADVIKYDQGVSSKIISISNSAFYGRGIEVFSLQRAMITIGLEEVKKIVMCLVFMNDMLKKLKLKREDVVDLWRHSLSVACAARVLSKKMLIEEPQKVFTISLLHDIGKTVFYTGAENYPAILKEATIKGKPVDRVERELFGTDHQEIGYAIGVKWRFPEEFLHVIRYHHEEGARDKYANLLRIVRAADHFALPSNMDPGPEGFILLNDRQAIEAETEKIASFLNIG